MRGQSGGHTYLVYWRENRQLTQRQMSELTGIPLGTYRRLERGEVQSPPLRLLVNCAIVLRLPLRALIHPDELRWQTINRYVDEPPDPDYAAQWFEDEVYELYT